MIFFTKLLYRDAASLCVCVCLTVLSFYFDTAVGLRPKLALIIWTDLRIVEPKKLPLPRQGGFEGVTFKKFGRCHELQRKSIHLSLGNVMNWFIGKNLNVTKHQVFKSLGNAIILSDYTANIPDEAG